MSSTRRWRLVYRVCVTWSLFWLGFQLVRLYTGEHVWWDSGLLFLGVWVGIYARYRAGVPLNWWPLRKAPTLRRKVHKP